jgi:hypothetical protein
VQVHNTVIALIDGSLMWLDSRKRNTLNIVDRPLADKKEKKEVGILNGLRFILNYLG